MTGNELIAAERKRQIEVEGWSPEHDDGHISRAGQMQVSNPVPLTNLFEVGRVVSRPQSAAAPPGSPARQSISHLHTNKNPVQYASVDKGLGKGNAPHSDRQIRSKPCGETRDGLIQAGHSAPARGNDESLLMNRGGSCRVVAYFEPKRKDKKCKT